MEGNVRRSLDEFLAARGSGLIAFRRDLHAHPETGRAEHRTTRVIAERLAAAGLDPVVLPGGTGLLADIAAAENSSYPERTVVALRADLDALPMDDEKDVPYRSTVAGACHACGHDVHRRASDEKLAANWLRRTARPFAALRFLNEVRRRNGRADRRGRAQIGENQSNENSSSARSGNQNLTRNRKGD